MANLPRFGRAWQRFSSLPRPGTASRSEVQPTTEPEVFPYAPTTTNILQTSPIRERASPVRKFPSPPSSPKYRATAISPPKPLSPISTYNRYNGERRTSATTSPKTFKSTTHISPPPSPAKHKYSPTTIAAPLSPLTLPHLEVRHEPEHTVRSRSPPEVQQKTILHEKPTKTEHRPSEHSSSKPHQKHQHQQHQQQQQSDVINIKGENVGAVMHITQSSDHGTEIHEKKAPSTTRTTRTTTTLGHNNTNNNNENEDQKGKKSSSSNNLPGKSFMNSNFQGVNNSIVYNSSLSHRDPGLHLAFSKKPNHADSLHQSTH